MGANKFFFSQFRRGISLIADYQFNNNLIDDANGYNLIGQNITYNNGNAVFNGTTSRASRTDTNDMFSFTDGVKDLPFRIETSIKFNAFTQVFQFIASKRGASNTLCEWQLFYSVNTNEFRFNLFSDGGDVDYFRLNCLITPSTETIYNIVIDYDGSGTLEGLNMLVNGVTATDKTEVGSYTNMVKTFFFAVADSLIGANYFNGEIDYLKIYK